MIFAFLDDGTLEVHEDLPSVQQEYEGVDVEDKVVQFYNKEGVYLEPDFIVPNRRGTILGLFGWVTSGVFQLIPNAIAEQNSFARALYETSSIAPNRWFASLEQLTSELSAKGVAVTFQPQNKNEADSIVPTDAKGAARSPSR